MSTSLINGWRKGITRASPPSLPKRIVNYGTAITKWLLAGRPKRTGEEIRKILNICYICDKFTFEKCAICGCCVNSKTGGLQNKIVMATEKCPEDKW
jgi:hypothetical protein